MEGVCDNLVGQNKEDEEDGVDDSQPQGNEDAEGVEVGSVEFGDEQIGALETLEQGVHGLLDALLQGECQEVEDLDDIGRLLGEWLLVVVVGGVEIGTWDR